MWQLNLSFVLNSHKHTEHKECISTWCSSRSAFFGNLMLHTQQVNVCCSSIFLFRSSCVDISLYTLDTRIHAYYCVYGWLDIFLMVVYLTLVLKRQITYNAVNGMCFKIVFLQTKFEGVAGRAVTTWKYMLVSMVFK